MQHRETHEVRVRPVVVVKDFGDCRIATKVHARLRRNAAGYWQVDGEFYNPITGELDSSAYCSLLGRKRSRKAAVAAAKSFVAKLAGWNWWYCSVQYAREVARNKGVFILRITKRKGQGIDEKLLKQFKSWAKSLLKANPGYVTDPGKLRSYVQGPNWNAPDCEYAHYKTLISLYGDELLGMFERLRAGKGEEGLAEYRSLLKAAGIEEDRS